MALFFLFFVLSGFCSLVYQVVWLREAMADFGVNTPLVSIVLSVFMAGLALGSWLAGALTRRIEGRTPGTFVTLYAITELTIAISGLVVSPGLGWGRRLLASATIAWGSNGYYLASGSWVTLVLLPFCTCMGATFPLAMAGIRAAFPERSARSFSFLYVANVLGASAGALASAFVLVELLGFRRTQLVAAAVNTAIAVMAWAVARSIREPAVTPPPSTLAGTLTLPATPERPRHARALLFTTGLTSLGMEVVWARSFVPFQGTVVYAFASTIAVYLLATVAGSWVYRRAASGLERVPSPSLPVGLALAAAALTALLPLAAADPVHFRYAGTDLARGTFRVLLGIGPFCALLGFLTPMLMDAHSRGNPERAGRAYALNTLGCILGPLLSGFVLLPLLGERMTLVALAVPFFVYALMATRDAWPSVPSLDRAALWTALFVTAFGGSVLALRTKDFETLYRQRVVRRDHTATVIAVLGPGPRQLLVNGVGITSLTPVTKMMVHLPMALLDRPAARGLVLCFGMGTSFRSMRAWGVPSTAVELVPSVPRLFNLFHTDAEEILAAPDAVVLIDDARRFLERSDERYDLIVVDPPPPVEAAGSSLLYSREFCELARRRLAPGGILQNWLPEGEDEVIGAVARALAETFREVRVFRSLEGWGFHFLASDSPLPDRSALELARRMPTAAAADLVEWGPARTAEEQFRIVLDREVPLSLLTPLGDDRRALSDDRPVNEYYMLRRLLHAPRVYSSMDPFPSPGLP